MRIVTVARRPSSERSTTENVTTWAAGALNVDACRIGYVSATDLQETVSRNPGTERRFVSTVYDVTRPMQRTNAAGRWPANLVLVHREGCRQAGTTMVPGYTINRWKDGAKPFGGAAGHEYESTEQGDEHVPVWSCAPGCPVETLGLQNGESKSSVGKPRRSALPGHGWGMTATGAEYRDSGTAARYFKQVQQETNMDAFPQELWNYLTTLIAPPPSCEPVIVTCSDLAVLDLSEHEDQSVHGMIVVGNPEAHMAEIDRVLRPGAHLLVVAPDDDPTGCDGACAVEDFGYEIRDAITVLDEPDEFHYVAKAPPKERHAGVTPRERVREIERLFPAEGVDRDLLIAELEDSVKPKHLAKMDEDGLDPEQVPDDAMWGLERRTIRTRRVVRCDHPTVKPIGVMERLLADVPRGRVLDPFMGSGTTGLACLRTGHDFVGIDQDEGYLQIADERIRHWDTVLAPWRPAQIYSEAPPLEDEAEPEGGVFDMFGGDE